MKWIITIFLFVNAFIAHSQSPIYPQTGSANGLNRIAGGLKIDSSVVVPIKDTVSWNGIKSDFIRKEGKLYYHDGSKYVSLGTLSGNIYISQIVGLQDTLNTKTAYNDTLSLLATKSNVNAVNVNSIVFTGSSTKTLTLTKNNGIQLQGNFTDNDNQTLSLSNSDTLSITNGNVLHLPYLRSVPIPSYSSFTGLITNTINLPNTPSSTGTVKMFMNNAFVDPVDWTRTGNLINLSFTTSANDLITIYYSY